MGFYHLFHTKTTCFGHKIMTTSCENDFNTESQSLLLIIISVSLFLYVYICSRLRIKSAMRKWGHFTP